MRPDVFKLDRREICYQLLWRIRPLHVDGYCILHLASAGHQDAICRQEARARRLVWRNLDVERVGRRG